MKETHVHEADLNVCMFQQRSDLNEEDIILHIALRDFSACTILAVCYSTSMNDHEETKDAVKLLIHTFLRVFVDEDLSDLIIRHSRNVLTVSRNHMIHILMQSSLVYSVWMIKDESISSIVEEIAGDRLSL